MTKFLPKSCTLCLDCFFKNPGFIKDLMKYYEVCKGGHNSVFMTIMEWLLDFEHRPQGSILKLFLVGLSLSLEGNFQDPLKANFVP